MQSNNSNESRAAPARGFIALFGIMLAMGLVLAASPAEAAPFAYVTGSNAVSVFDTATNKVLATVPLGRSPQEVAVSPDGNHAYVANADGTVSVIDAATNKIVATIPFGGSPSGMAIAPDGNRVYVANSTGASNNVSVIGVATKTVVATVRLGGCPGLLGGIAVSPGGKLAYVGNGFDENPVGDGIIQVIDTATNTVAATIPNQPAISSPGIAVAPDGKHAYATNSEAGRDGCGVSVIDTAAKTVAAMVGIEGGGGCFLSGIAITPDGKHAYVPFVAVDGRGVAVIATATNTVEARIPVAPSGGVAVTPDGKHAYVTTDASSVLVINTVTNSVVATVPVPAGAGAVGIVPPPPGIPFLAFSGQLAIHFGGAPNQDSFKLQSSFTLGSASNGIKPFTEAVTLQVGTFTTTIPPGSFQELAGGPFLFQGLIDGVALDVLITPTGTKRFALTADAKGANLTGTKNEVQVSLIIGDDSSTTSVKAQISGTAPVTAQIAH